jgi:hypothetical protein
VRDARAVQQSYKAIPLTTAGYETQQCVIKLWRKRMQMSLVTECVLDVFKFQLQITRIVKYKAGHFFGIMFLTVSHDNVKKNKTIQFNIISILLNLFVGSSLGKSCFEFRRQEISPHLRHYTITVVTS